MKTILLMTITPADLPIAKYCLASIIPALSENVHLKLFFNGVRYDLQKNFLDEQNLTENVFIKSNWAHIQANSTTIKNQVGAFFDPLPDVSDFREGVYESCGEVWSRELVVEKNYDLVGIVDADFEIFSPKLFECFQQYFIEDNKLAFWSVDYSPRRFEYEPYSKTKAWIEERWHTWFCVYRRSALEKECHFYYLEEQTSEGIIKYDHSAKLQQKLILEHGFRGRSLEKNRKMFIHYGAFAKNRSLDGPILYLYRLLRIGKYNGYLHSHNSRLLATPLRIFFAVIYKTLRMQRFDKERSRYIFET